MGRGKKGKFKIFAFCDVTRAVVLIWAEFSNHVKEKNASASLIPPLARFPSLTFQLHLRFSKNLRAELQCPQIRADERKREDKRGNCTRGGHFAHTNTKKKRDEGINK